jgi:hypothetical protein
MPPGCKFEPRCPYAWETCVEAEPKLIELRRDRTARCWLNDPRFADRLAAYEATLKPGLV